MSNLPIHPRTGLTALEVLPSGRIVWPVLGGDGTNDGDTGDKPTDDKPTDDKPDKGTDSATAEIEKWKALARKHEERAKENYEKAKKLDELQDASKSDIDKATERAEAAEKKAAEMELKAIRAEIGARKGVPADLLAGATEAEIEAAADKLLAFRGENKPDFGGGDRGKDVGSKKIQWTKADIDKAYAEKRYADITKAKEEGLLRDAMQSR